MHFPRWVVLPVTQKMYSRWQIAERQPDTGYKTLNLHRPGNNGTLYIHREIARLFLSKVSTKHKYVIHVNHNKLDNALEKFQMGHP